MKMPTSPREVGTPDRTAGQKYSAQEVSAPGMIRTCDTGFRRAVLYPLSYEGGPAGSLPPSSSPTPACWPWLCLSGRVVGAVERDQVAVTTIGCTPGIVFAYPRRYSGRLVRGTGHALVHYRHHLSPSAVRRKHCPTDSLGQVPVNDAFPDDRSAQCIYDLCEVFAMVVLNREIGHTVRVALRDEGFGDVPR